MSQNQPLMNRKMLNRLAFGLMTIAIILFGWNFLSRFFEDPDLGSVNSTGWIAAIEETPNGSQAVIIKSSGQVVASPDFADGNQDQGIVWQPDGNRLFFSSDRDPAKSFHIFRWNPAKEVVQDRSIGSRSQDNPTFPIDSLQPIAQNFLIISGGLVDDFNPRNGETHQQIPFVGRNPTEAEGGQGVGSQFGPEYKYLGTAFRIARWCDDKKYIVGVMERDTGGETLVVQNMNPTNTEDAMPVPVIAGDHIDFTIDPASGSIVYCVQNWRVIDPDHPPKGLVKGNKIVPPFENAIGDLNLNDPTKSGIVAASPDNTMCFGMPAITPDGSKILFVAGNYSNGLVSQGLFVCANQPRSSTSLTQLLRGSIYSPSWSPDGKQMTFIKPGTSGKNDVFTMGNDGSNLKDLTNGSGNFSAPQFSPQTISVSSSTP